VPELSLEIVEGTGAGELVAVTGPVTIGRSRDADLVLADELVSRRHAVVTPTATGAVVEDLGSRNGTFVNGQDVHGPVRLESGDQLQLGITLVELRSATQIAERPSAVHPVPPPLAVPARTPDYLAGADADDRAPPAEGDNSAAAAGPAPALHPAPADGLGPVRGQDQWPGPRPANRPRHELEPLLDSRTKGKARTAPLALFVLVALVVIIYLATAR
jgi:pSer/pThr/pTyr-binding forkhead associated (FHA) protein